MKLIMSDKPLNINIQNGNDTKYFDLSSLKIANCMGCFRCWTKTPGKCVIRDDATAVYPCIAKSNKVIYVSRLKYGGYDSVMKTMPYLYSRHSYAYIMTKRIMCNVQ